MIGNLPHIIDLFVDVGLHRVLLTEQIHVHTPQFGAVNIDTENADGVHIEAHFQFICADRCAEAHYRLGRPHQRQDGHGLANGNVTLYDHPCGVRRKNLRHGVVCRADASRQ